MYNCSTLMQRFIRTILSTVDVSTPEILWPTTWSCFSR